MAGRDVNERAAASVAAALAAVARGAAIVRCTTFAKLLTH
jgi:hypothetical protein